MIRLTQVAARELRPGDRIVHENLAGGTCRLTVVAPHRAGSVEVQDHRGQAAALVCGRNDPITIETAHVRRIQARQAQP